MNNDEQGADHRLELYKLLVEMADRVSQRRQSANSFYLSVNTLLVGGSAYLGTFKPALLNVLLISIAGIAICVLWIQNIGSYKTLNGAKFAVITALEKSMVAQPFTQEWEHLDPNCDGERHRPFHRVEVLVPWVFAAVYAAQVFVTVPWREALKSACSW